MSRAERLRFLRGVYFFDSLSDEEIHLLEKVCEQESCSAGEIVFREGDAADRFYIVMSGEIEVWKDYGAAHPDLLAVHTTGHFFGEMALVDELPRSATIRARTAANLLSIPRDAFHALVRAHSSIALSLLKSVSAMVRTSNESFVQGLRRRNAELERLYADLQRTQAELLRNERLSTLGKFSSLILHDIKNPLSILRGFAELIVFQSKDPARVESSARKIMTEADRISGLVQELLDYARGEIRLNVSAVALDEFIGEVVEALQPRFRREGVEIAVNVRYAGPVLMDVGRMRRVLYNLADNALKASSRGDRFEISVHPAPESYLVEVRDTGVGMSEETRENLFEPFFSASGRGGTGLGMAIVRSIVQAHHGTVEVESREGAGTTVRISLPQNLSVG